MVMRRCRHLLKDEHLAKDAMQDVFVNLLRHHQNLTDDAPSSLLFRIATNVCLNKIRSLPRDPTRVLDQSQNETLLYQIATNEDLERQTGIQNLLEVLFRRNPASSRTIAVMHFLDGFTLKEVAKHVKMSESGVRKRLRNLRKQIHELEKA